MNRPSGSVKLAPLALTLGNGGEVDSKRQGERRIQVYGDLPLPLDTAARSVHTLKEHAAIHSTGSIEF